MDGVGLYKCGDADMVFHNGERNFGLGAGDLQQCGVCTPHFPFNIL